MIMNNQESYTIEYPRRSIARSVTTALGILIAMLAGSPVWADDVELLLSTPSSSAAKPNILFIIDSSGSMTTIEKSQEPYDSTLTYTGPCRSDMYYWATNSNIPSCGSERRIYRTSFVCDTGIAQALSAGSYTDTMAMYRSRKGKLKWQRLSKSKTSNDVECEADSGMHGKGASPGDLPYAQTGSNIDQYTNDDSREVSWGDSPTHQNITMYDSNYLNWYHNPPGTSMSRTNIVKAVTKNVLSSVNNVNVGFMRFNYSSGGPVIHAVKDLDSNRVAVNKVVDDIPASGWTPLSETMYEAARYWRGMPALYGLPADTDPDAYLSSGTEIYDQPSDYSCAKNFVVLLTDGAPTKDVDAYYRTPTLPNFSSAMGRGSCDGGNVDGACLDDIAEYLSKQDISPTVPGEQTVTTFTIGFTVDLPLLKETAESSGGEYYLASDVKSLTAALTDIVTNIFDRDISFTAPAVAVNAFNRTQHLNDMYIPVFRATDEMHWPGNMKKYTIKEGEIRDANDANAIDPTTGYFADSAKNFWSRETEPDGSDVFRGGVANVLPSPSVRKIYTNNVAGNLTVGSNALSNGNQAAYSIADFGLVGAAGEPSMTQIIDWVRGVDVKDEDGDPDTITRRAMGDTLHSQPATVVYGNVDGTQDIVLFNATNDGYLHAIDTATGQEKWAFIPRELLGNLADLYINENVDFKNYGIDGDLTPVIIDANHDGIIEVGTDLVYLIFGMRRGGENYYALDVTDNDRPALKWLRNYPQLGQTWSTPVAAKVNVNSSLQTSAQKAVLVFGAGYDTVHDAAAHPSSADVEGAGIFMVDLETGEPIWRAGADISASLPLSGMTRSIPSRISVIDMSGDGYSDRMYASDLGGQIWRFDITNGNIPTELVAGGVIAQLGAEGIASPTPAETRRFYTSPDIAMFTDTAEMRRYLSINIGSGYRAHPLNNTSSDALYSIRDPYVFQQLTQTQYNAYPVIEHSDLVDVAGQYGTTMPKNGDGWKFVLPPGQKVLSDARTFNDSVYFVTFEAGVNSVDPCQAGLSVNRVYKMDVSNGDPSFGTDDGSLENATPEEIDAARVMMLEQGGIAPVAVFMFPSAWDQSCKGDECRPEPVVCVGVECFDPDYNNNPIRTLWTQDGME